MLLKLLAKAVDFLLLSRKRHRVNQIMLPEIMKVFLTKINLSKKLLCFCFSYTFEESTVAQLEPVTIFQILIWYILLLMSGFFL